MVTSTKGNIKMENSMGKGSILGQMDHAMKANSYKESGMDREAGNLLNRTEIFTSVPTRMIRKMAMVDMSGQTDVCTKEVSLTTSSNSLFI
jgi:hypothetical protein